MSFSIFIFGFFNFSYCFNFGFFCFFVIFSNFSFAIFCELDEHIGCLFDESVECFLWDEEVINISIERINIKEVDVVGIFDGDIDIVHIEH